MKTVNQVIDELKNSIMNLSKQPNFMNCMIIYFIIYVMLLILPIYLYNLSKGQTLTSNQYAYIYFFMYIMGMFLCIMLFFNSEINKKLYMFIFILLIIIIGVLLYFYKNAKNFSKQYTFIFSVIFQLVFVFIIIVALALTYKIFENNFRNQTGLLGFMIDFIFYIPCLLIEFFQYIGKEVISTPSIVFILFVIEILLLLTYYYIPTLIQNSIFSNEIQILQNYEFLNNKKQIAENDDLMPIITVSPDNGLDIKTPRNIYTISMWIYVNQQYHNNRLDKYSTNIFSYGSQNNYKPKISYTNSKNKNQSKNLYHITFFGDENIDNGYSIELNSQKWNHIVFNYNESSVDLYVNGILERTHNIYKGGITYLPTDVITIGEDNGLEGAICNVAFYTVPLTNYQIVNIYNLLMNKNPPIT